MKIAVNTRFLIPDRLTDVGKFTHEVLRRLAVKYPEHEFYFLFDRAFDPQYIYSVNVKPVVVYPSVRHPVLYYWWYQVSLARALQKIKPDVFLSTDGMTTLNARVPRVTVMSDLVVEHFPQEVDYLSRKYLKNYNPRFAQISAKIITFSAFTRQEISRLYKINSGKIEVVAPAAGEEFRKIDFGRQVAVRQKYTNGEAYFISVGALQPRQNIANLFRAFDLFKEKTGSEVKLLIAGNNKLKSRGIKQVYKQMRFKSEVVFTDRVKDAELIELYGAAVAAVYVPLRADAGISVIEAQKCGCPVVAAATGALPEVAGAGALLVNPVAIEEISEALIQVYHDLEVRSRLVQAGFRNTEKFSWDKSAEKVMRLLEETVKTQATSRAHL
ncbi:glycosyltransferase family 4 protein [Adhaeribacter aerolatus]|uniref:glycosyltransferase family 4 protein n=1 Tax=Adhaeribacter aerolatus TaxID=670289 RepID=UPI0014797701|nr:glycosyltransferase family 1 protein [Adhaeribacter aerolatus]